MKHTPQVIDITEEEEADVEKSTTQPKVEEGPSIQDSLKKLTKQITKYKRQLIKATSEEEQKNIQKSIDYINELRFLLKMSPTNKSIINRVLTFIESPIDYQGIVEDVLSKIESNEI